MSLKRAVGGTGLRVAAGMFRGVRGAVRAWRPLRNLRDQPVQSVLALSPLKIGDAIQVEPALRALRAAWPDARLVLALRPLVAGLGPCFASVDQVVEDRGAQHLREALRGRPDVAVSFGLRFGAAWTAWQTGALRTVGYDDSGRGMLLTDPVRAPAWVNRPRWDYPALTPVPQAQFWLDLLAAVGIPGAGNPVPKLRLPEAARERADALLREAGLAPGERLLWLHPGAEAAYRWLPERFAAVATRLATRPGFRLGIGGGPGDRAAVDAVLAGAPRGMLDLTGRTTLPEYLAVLARAACLVAVDTSATHLAAAVGTPVVALFGPGDPRIWAPAGAGHRVVQGVNPDCYGCKRPACFRERHFCMGAISAEAVGQAAEIALGEPPVPPGHPAPAPRDPPRAT